jgi:hypothetical protein
VQYLRSGQRVRAFPEFQFQNNKVEEVFMNELTEQIEEARVRVAHYRGKAERPGSRLEDEFALEKARNRLLTLELRLIKQWPGPQAIRQTQKPSEIQDAHQQTVRSRVRSTFPIIQRTKRKHISISAREKAEADFAVLQAKRPEKNSVTGEQEDR